MIVRVVKMEFKSECIEAFKALFEERKENIRNFPGCQYLELLQGLPPKNNIFFTYSYWDSEDELNNYRYSELFKSTWDLTKKMFSQKAQAISLEKAHILD
ncbi:MAG: antibiotic biosynthesis monooxygenase [Saprospiraceae bacterium]|nr:antibiotic biosynthesis monooxygenase [Saprospiraceae bacterium]